MRCNKVWVLGDRIKGGATAMPKEAITLYDLTGLKQDLAAARTL